MLHLPCLCLIKLAFKLVDLLLLLCLLLPAQGVKLLLQIAALLCFNVERFLQLRQLELSQPQFFRLIHPAHVHRWHVSLRFVLPKRFNLLPEMLVLLLQCRNHVFVIWSTLLFKQEIQLVCASSDYRFIIAVLHSNASLTIKSVCDWSGNRLNLAYIFCWVSFKSW